MLAITWGAAQLVQRRKQLPFGGQRGEATDSWPGDRGFLGGTTDPTGTTHLGAREYDPTLGRFLSVDPLLIPDDPRQHNPYQYGNNNPLTFSDPTGEAFEECRSGQYKCNYDRKGKLTGVEYGKNYEKITRSVGGTPAPRYIRQKQRIQYACAEDPGCTGTAQQLTALAQKKREAERAARARVLGIAQRNSSDQALQYANGLVALSNAVIATQLEAGNASTRASNLMRNGATAAQRSQGARDLNYLRNNHAAQKLAEFGRSPVVHVAAKTLFWAGVAVNATGNYRTNDGDIGRTVVQTGAQIGYDVGVVYAFATVGGTIGSTVPGLGTVVGTGGGALVGAGFAFFTSPTVGGWAGRTWDTVTGWW